MVFPWRGLLGVAALCALAPGAAVAEEGEPAAEAQPSKSTAGSTDAAASAAQAQQPPQPPPAARPPPPRPVAAAQPASPPPPPPPPSFDSEHQREVAVNNSISKVMHAVHMASSSEGAEVDQDILRDAYVEAVGLGIKNADVERLRQLMQDNAKKLVDAAMAHQTDVPLEHMNKLIRALQHADLDGHSGPHVTAARKLRNEKISAAIDAAGFKEDLGQLHMLVHHARTHARDELSTVISAAERKLFDKAIETVTQHKFVGEKDRNKLRDAIQVCQAEGIGSEHLDEAHHTLKVEDTRHRVKEVLPPLMQENDYEMLRENIRNAQDHGINDVEVATAQQHVSQIVREMLAQAAKSVGGSGTVRRLVPGPNGTTTEVEEPAGTAGLMGVGDMDRALTYAALEGLPETEIAGARAALEQRLKATLQAALAKLASVTLSTPGFSDVLREVQSASGHYRLPQADGAAGEDALRKKFLSLLTEASSMGWTMKEMGFAKYAELLEFGVRAHPTITLADLESHIQEFQVAAIKEFEEAIASNDLQRLWRAGEARRHFHVVIDDYPQLEDRTYNKVKVRQLDAEEFLSRKRDVLAELDKILRQETGQRAVSRLRDVLGDCEAEGLCSATDRAPYEAKMAEFAKEVEAARAAAATV